MTMGEVGWVEPPSGSTVTAAALTRAALRHRNRLDPGVPVGFRLEGHRRHRPAILDEPELVRASGGHGLQPIAVDDGAMLLPVPEELNARIGIPARRELEHLHAGLEDRVQRGLPLVRRCCVSPACASQSRALSRRSATGSGWTPGGAHADRQQQARRDREPAGHPDGAGEVWREASGSERVLARRPRSTAPARGGAGRRRSAAGEREQRGDLAVLGYLALRLRRRGQVRLEPPRLVGRQRAERVRRGEILRRVGVRAGHVPRSK